MADGGDNEPSEDTVRRQVLLKVICVVDVPADMLEDEVRFLVEEQMCKSGLIMSLAEQINDDDKEGECNVCMVAETQLIPTTAEIQFPWLDKLPEPSFLDFDADGDDEAGGEEDDEDDDLPEDVEEDDEDEPEGENKGDEEDD